MALIPLSERDIEARRALRAEFARFWSSERGDPRTIYDKFVAKTPVAAGVTVGNTTHDPGPGVWVRPAGAATEQVVLFLHGGGYGLGRPTAYVGLVSQLAVRAQTATFVLDYPLAPEAQLPEALDLAVETLSRLCGDHAAVAIAGDSAGGGLTLATAAQAAQRQLDVAAVVTFSPWTDLTLSGGSVLNHAIGDPLLDPGYLRASAAAYTGSVPARDPRASPLFGDVSGIPPTLIQVGSDEVLLDDSHRYADAVEKAGGEVHLEIWQGMHHVFQLNVTELFSARAALDNAGWFLAAQLKKG